MPILFLLAALGNQLTFDTRQQGNTYTIVPVATLAQECECRVKLTPMSSGASGQSNSSQSSTVLIKANQPTPLSQMQLTLSAGDSITIMVSVTDGKEIHLEKQWASPGQI